MAVKFEIEDIFEIKGRGIVITARNLDRTDPFWITPNMRLGNVPIRNKIDMAKRIDKEGNLTLDTYYFEMENEADKNKLQKGEIVELLPGNKLEFLPPWEAIQGGLEAELEKEINEQHPLFGKTVKSIGRRVDCDDVLFIVEAEKYALVHLIWSGKKERFPHVPYTEIFNHWTEVYEKVMLRDHEESNQIKTPPAAGLKTRRKIILPPGN